MGENNPFGSMPIDDHKPAGIVAQFAEKIEQLSDAECQVILDKVEADIKAKREMAGARAALESVLGLAVRILA